ncbi:hypothetical protein EDD86DRAFT_220541 [Gorgonomyces haynaldii]|nr:hypothetical protein EDD86DRAFT_220541 [Gorgonomyces haynaldii]
MERYVGSLCSVTCAILSLEMNEWDSIAQAYEKVFMPRFQPMYDAMAAQVPADSDVACFGDGPGEPSLTIAPKAKSILVMDGAHEMLNVAQKRFQTRQIQAQFLHTPEGEPIPREFQVDCMCSSLCLMYIPKSDGEQVLEGVLSDLMHKLKKGGLLITSHWDHPDSVPFLKILKETNAIASNNPVHSEAQYLDQGTFSFAQGRRYEQVYRKLGLEILSTEIVRLEMPFKDCAEFCEFNAQGQAVNPKHVEIMQQLVKQSGREITDFTLPSNAVVVVARN